MATDGLAVGDDPAAECGDLAATVRGQGARVRSHVLTASAGSDVRRARRRSTRRSGTWGGRASGSVRERGTVELSWPVQNNPVHQALIVLVRAVKG